MKTLLRDKASGLYFRTVGTWVKDPNDAFVFKNTGRAFEFCLHRRLWGTQIILQFIPTIDDIVLTIEKPAGKHWSRSLAVRDSAGAAKFG